MSSTRTTIITTPEHTLDCTPLPQKIDIIRQVRTGKVKPSFSTSEPSGIYKTPHSKPVKVAILGLEGDESAYIPHTGPDNAIMHYPSQHYALWQEEIPQNAHLFTEGAFGENLVSENLHEGNVCIGDTIRVGREVLLQVTKPRQPCYKLNHRFEMKDMSLRSQNLNRTGWYYRVLQGGWLEAGNEMVLVERKYPQWTIKNIQKYLHKDIKNEEAMKELAYLPELGEEIKTIFLNRLTKRKFLDESLRLGIKRDEAEALKWKKYRLVEKKNETPRICSFVFEAVDYNEKPTKVMPGSHIRVKLGENGKLVRAYSVVGGDSNRFELGVALDVDSRGGSKFLHEEVNVGDTLSFSEIKSDFPLNDDANQHILVAGGIGITAFITAAQHLQRHGSKYQLLYAVRSSEDIAFSRYLVPLGGNAIIFDASVGKRLDIPQILRNRDAGTHIYVCGPERLLSAITTAADLANFPKSNIHFEAFTASTSGDPFTVELVNSKRTLEVKQEQTLLDVLRDAGFEVPSSCEVGNCGTCKVEVCSGRVEHRGTGLIEHEKRGSMLSCVSRGIGRIIIDI
jgi:MOSC domain-containing protein YiiM/ferredoxin-NADP reductase